MTSHKREMQKKASKILKPIHIISKTSNFPQMSWGKWDPCNKKLHDISNRSTDVGNHAVVDKKGIKASIPKQVTIHCIKSVIRAR